MDECYAPAGARTARGDNRYNEPVGGLGVGTGVCEAGCGVDGRGGFAHGPGHAGTWLEALRKLRVHASTTGSVMMMTSTALAGSSVLIAVAAGVKDDAFLVLVTQMVKESDDGRWKGFFRVPDSTLRYHREGDETARICW